MYIEDKEEQEDVKSLFQRELSKQQRFWLDVSKVGDKWMVKSKTEVAGYTPVGPLEVHLDGECVRSLLHKQSQLI